MNREVFNTIYEKNLWGDRSGPGSKPENAEMWINLVNLFLDRKDIKTVLDLGCGDWQLGQKLNLKNKEYLGVEVSSVILEETSKYSSDNIKFINDDIETMVFSNVDLILVKEVLQHLPNKSVINIMNKVMKNCRYAIICNDFDATQKENLDINPGEWRPLNLLGEPFNYKMDRFYVFIPPHHPKLIEIYKNDSIQ